MNNPDYRWFVVDTTKMKIMAGNESHDALLDMPHKGKNMKIMSIRTLKMKGLNPDDDFNWSVTVLRKREDDYFKLCMRLQDENAAADPYYQRD